MYQCYSCGLNPPPPPFLVRVLGVHCWIQVDPLLFLHPGSLHPEGCPQVWAHSDVQFSLPWGGPQKGPGKHWMWPRAFEQGISGCWTRSPLLEGCAGSVPRLVSSVPRRGASGLRAGLTQSPCRLAWFM